MRLFEFTQDMAEASGYDGSEPLDLSKNPSVNDVFKRALYIYDYEGYGNDMDYSEDEAIEQYVAQKFGQDVLDQLNTAKNQQYFGRADGKGPGGGGRTSNLGTSSAPGGKFRTTKAGKMHGQDAKIMKGQIANRLGRHPAPSLPESELTESDNPVAGAITRRIMLQRSDLLQKYGPVKVMAAIDDVADFVGDTEEIGSSDVSGWVKQVEQSLAGMTGEGVAEAGRYGSNNPDTMSATNYDRYQQDQMDQGKRDFKRQEHEHEWEQEKAYSAKLAADAAGPWYIRIDGRIYRQGGQPKVFDLKKGANNYALAMIKNNPALQGKVMLSKSAEDK